MTAPPADLNLFKLAAQGSWRQLVELCERTLDADPAARSYAWYLGLALLMLGQEDEAQMTWFMAVAGAKEEDIEVWTQELLVILDTEAERQQLIKAYSRAWGIRQHMRELDPTNLGNLLLLLLLSSRLGQFEPESLDEWHVLSLLEQAQPSAVSLPLLAQTLADILSRYAVGTATDRLVQISYSHFQVESPPAHVFIDQAKHVAYHEHRPAMAAALLKQVQRLIPDNPSILQHLSCFHQDAGQYSEAIAVAQHCFDIAPSLLSQVSANHVLLRGLMTVGSDWAKIYQVFERHLELLQRLVAHPPENVPPVLARWLFTAPFFQPYLRDDLAANRALQNQVAAIAQTQLQQHCSDRIQRYQFAPASASRRPLKVGYISSCLRRHSVGWLARWLYRHHDREQVALYSYLVDYRSEKPDTLRDWFVAHSDQVRQLGTKAPLIADGIYDDGIDILVDLDSITLDTTCEVMALKPAPVQVTWLGWDASGIPAVDYFIADPYVLPEWAESHYQETLWRLPHTYVAVDGFEVAVPDLRRQDVDIPDAAVVYFSGQRGYKRHPQTVRLQMRILAQVPDSYFMIKGAGDRSVQDFFTQIAHEEGVAAERLRFLPRTPSEASHRANLALADVVLDTYPYNGATTTLETLWVGIPLVTRVGETFSSRNSYTMMRNAGITEGIAWTDDEYIAWGIRLGQDPALRQQVTWKLWQGRRTAPLWNGRQFARDMEQAYQQMWERRVSSR